MQLSYKRPSTFGKVLGRVWYNCYFSAANVANGEATTVYNLCNNSVGEASGVSGWGDRDQLSRISSDLNSKSTQTRGSPTCQTERVIRAHCSIGEPGEQLVTLPSHTTYPVSSCASCLGHSGGRADGPARTWRKKLRKGGSKGER